MQDVQLENYLLWLTDRGVRYPRRQGLGPTAAVGCTTSSDNTAGHLSKWRETVSNCPHCQLPQGVTVFGGGSERPKVVFVGDRPQWRESGNAHLFSAEEEALLSRMTAAMRLLDSDVHFTTAILSVAASTPSAHEFPCAASHLIDLIETLKPFMMIFLGQETVDILAQSHGKFAIDRSKLVAAGLFPCMSLLTDHPRRLLLEPTAKKQTWADLQIAMAALAAANLA